MIDSVHATLSDADLALARSTLFNNTLRIPMPPLPALRDTRGRGAEGGRVMEEAGSLAGMAHSHLGLAEVARLHGDFDQARSHYEQALELHRRLGSPLGEANSLLGLADIAMARGDHAAARAAYEQSLGIYRMVGVPDEQPTSGRAAE